MDILIMITIGIYKLNFYPVGDSNLLKVYFIYLEKSTQ